MSECKCKPTRYDAHAWDKTRESDEWIRECQSMWESVYRDASKKHKYRKHWHPPVKVH